VISSSAMSTMQSVSEFGVLLSYRLLSFTIFSASLLQYLLSGSAFSSPLDLSCIKS